MVNPEATPRVASLQTQTNDPEVDPVMTKPASQLSDGNGREKLRSRKLWISSAEQAAQCLAQADVARWAHFPAHPGFPADREE